MKQEEISLAEVAAKGNRQNEPELFGLLHKHINYGEISEFYNHTLAQVASAEWDGIEKILRQTFAPSSTELI